jgi:peptidoglycan/LPS O-acetylase OafA/YrhL
MAAHLRGDAFVEYGALPVSQHGVLAALFFGLTRQGYEAVIVFFALSGFLVGGQVLSRVRNRKFQIRDYAIDRSTRILIPLIPACLFTAAIDLFVFGHGDAVGQLAGNMFGLNEIIVPTLQTNPVLWSLAYEIWFYIIAGTLAFIISERPSVVSLLVLGLCVAAFSVLKLQYLVFWALGACASLFVRIRFKKTLLFSGGLLFLAGSFFYQMSHESRSITPVIYMSPLVAEYFMGIGASMTLPFFAGLSVNKAIAPAGRVAGALAAFSYTLYLIHRPTDVALDQVFGRADILSLHSLFYFGLRIAICLAVAVCFYFVFERNTSILRKYLRGDALRLRTVKSQSA